MAQQLPTQGFFPRILVASWPQNLSGGSSASGFYDGCLPDLWTDIYAGSPLGNSKYRAGVTCGNPANSNLEVYRKL
ncbi:MAG: hypothetical protein IPN18_13325 [Ignavibacteriales bacterium]|nr:hypothetical protein [Ignavibacteriales bacterium]